jgi:hypothetical protein
VPLFGRRTSFSSSIGVSLCMQISPENASLE